MVSIKLRFEQVNNRPSGFDYLRLVLSISVLAFHSIVTTGGRVADLAMWESPLGVLVRQILPMFFALSGFLVAGSLYRCHGLVHFLGLRAIRIYPALTVEVVLSALLLGPLATTFSASEYFSDPIFYQYFWNVIGHIHYKLPGVFLNNPLPDTVNVQLWTVPYELYCYLLLGVLYVAGITKRVWLAAAAPFVLLAVYFVGRLVAHNGVFPSMDGGGPGSLLVDSFLFGVAIYILKDWIPWDGRLFAVALVSSLAAANWYHYGVLLVPMFSAYCVVYLGLLNPKRLKVIAGADYSYGIFLYGFAIQQALVHFLRFSNPWLNIVVALVLATIMAAISWHFVEKPALRLKKFLERSKPAAATMSVVSTG
jgi:peptidoglycan/LPS O-acetylase OafA/YrhL